MLNIERILAIFLVLFSVGGCAPKGPVRPDGLPTLFPCEITITQEDKPLVGALVELRNKSQPSSWATDGVTDENGVAKIKINGTFPGAPEGEYQVLVTKSELSPSKLPETPPTDPIELGKWNQARSLEPRDVFRLVEAQYGDSQKSPHSVTVSKDGGKGAFDVGKAIREMTFKASDDPPADSSND